MGLWDEWGVSLAFWTFYTPNLATTIRVGATITKKNKYFLLEATEEAVATIIVEVLFVLSTPNAMPLLTQRHRPNHGGFATAKNIFFLLKA